MQEDIAYKLAQIYDVSLTSYETEALRGIMQRHIYNKEENVVALRQRNRFMYFIEQGILRQYYYKDGRNITEHFGIEDDLMFCIESLFLGTQSQLGIETIEASTVWTIDYKQLKELTNTHRGINQLYQTIFERDLVLSQRKADSWRFESSHERYERFCREYPEVARRASIAHIASYLLMSPETLSRVRAGAL